MEKKVEERLPEFDAALQALQNTYKFRLVAQVTFPGGAMLNVPITVVDLAPAEQPAAEGEIKEG